MKNFYLFLGLLIAILVALLLSEPQKETSFTELNIKKNFFNNSLTVESTIGRQFTHENFLNKTSLVFFGYTRCPDFCPDTLMKLGRIYKSLNNKKHLDKSKLQIIFISVDTENDSLPTIKNYLQYFNEYFVGLKLNKTDLKMLTKSANVYYKKTSSDPDVTLYDHTSAVFIVDNEGKLMGVFTPPYLESDLENDIISLLNQI